MARTALTLPTGAALARTGAFAVATGAAVVVGQLTTMAGTDLSLAWPAAGVVALWFCVQRGARTLAVDVVALAVSVAAAWTALGASPTFAAVFVAASLAQVAVVQLVLGRWVPHVWGAGGTQPLAGTSSLASVLTAAVLGSAAAAAVGLAGLVAAGQPWTWVQLAIWLVRSSVSILLVLGLGLRVGYLVSSALRRRAAAAAGGASPVVLPMRRPRPAEAAELFLLAAASVGAYVLIFLVLPNLPVAFPLLVLTVWAALRFDTSVVVVHSQVVGVLAVLLTLEGAGPFAGITDVTVRCLVVQVFVGVASLLGLVLALGRDERHLLLRQVREHAREAEQRAEHVQVLAQASRTLHSSDDVRADICRAAQHIAGADLAQLFEPDDAGDLVATAVAGHGAVVRRLARGEGPSLTVEVMRTRRARFVGDVDRCEEVAPAVRRLPGCAAGVWQPVPGRGEACLGVLVLMWHHPVERLPEHVLPMVETLASEAGSCLEREDLLRRLAEAADRDQLTGLANRRCWDVRAEAEVGRARRTGEPLTVAIVDLDHFKGYNDTFGHLAGDRLLRAFAQEAQGLLREVDVLARWGGEEFALALPGCRGPEAVSVLRRLHEAVPDGQSCTVGVAQWEPGESVAAVMERADRALYEGKEAGRDRTVLAPAPSAARAGAGGSGDVLLPRQAARGELTPRR
ncbi:GGDEF domain-containing protein [Pseudokineococcus sp. 1T1Z-3]|uniref:GGDEF domain-containing protein n=1 Tax=Pseudokineococcus sp. 1T1Z-3 TaxID=3132745 RepID=UPI0030B59048